MKRVPVGDLREHLDAYVRAVREGETIVVCEDGEAVAELRPVVEVAGDLQIEMPTKVPDEGRAITGVVPRSGYVDVVAILRESRDQR